MLQRVIKSKEVFDKTEMAHGLWAAVAVLRL